MEKFESFHHGFMLGLFVLSGKDFIVESNKEYGLGRPLKRTKIKTNMMREKVKMKYLLKYRIL